MLTVRDAVGPFPAGLGPPSSAPLPAGAELDALLGAAPPGVDDVLARLTWGPPVGAFPRADRPVDPSSRSPVEWLLARRLLAAGRPGRTWCSPARSGCTCAVAGCTSELRREPPPWDGTEREVAAVDSAAGAAAGELVRWVGELGELWGGEPPGVLRAGGLGVRDLRRTALALDVPEPTAAVVVEVAFAAGLVADDGEVGASWLPTPAFDAWTAASPPARWRQLAQAWLASSRVPGLVGSRDEKDSPRAALSDAVERPVAGVVRADTLHELADALPGYAPTSTALLERLRWRRPRRTGRLHDQLVGWTLSEAELLGVTGRGALSSAGRALLAGDGVEEHDPPAAAEARRPRAAAGRPHRCRPRAARHRASGG